MENHTGHMVKTNDNSGTMKWLGICIGIVALAIIAVKVFNVSVNNIAYFAVLLACPLMHFWMMKDGGHKH